MSLKVFRVSPALFPPRFVPSVTFPRFFSEVFFRDVPKITCRDLFRILIGNCLGILGVPLGSSLVVAFAVLAEIFVEVFLQIFSRITYEIPCKKFLKKYRKIYSWSPARNSEKTIGEILEKKLRKSVASQKQILRAITGWNIWEIPKGNLKTSKRHYGTIFKSNSRKLSRRNPWANFFRYLA